MKKVKFAFVGAGYMANEYAKVLKSEFKNKSKIVGVINKSNKRINDFVKNYNVSNQYFELNKMMTLSKPDVVVVCVNELATYNVLKILCNYPCICLIEKPVGIDFNESKKILKLKKNKSFKPFVALNRRHYSSVKNVQKIISSDNSPRVIKIFDQENTIVAKQSGQPLKVIKNWMYANSIHMIDFVYNFGRGKIKKIVKNNKVKTTNDGFFSCNIYFDSGDLVVYDCLWNRPAPWSLQISTKNYFVELKPIEQSAFLTNKNRKWNNIKISNFDKIYKPGIYSMLIEIFNFQHKKRANLQDLKYSNSLMELINKIYID